VPVITSAVKTLSEDDAAHGVASVIGGVEITGAQILFTCFDYMLIQSVAGVVLVVAGALMVFAGSVFGAIPVIELSRLVDNARHSTVRNRPPLTQALKALTLDLTS
jgi:hypothetical protein